MTIDNLGRDDLAALRRRLMDRFVLAVPTSPTMDRHAALLARVERKMKTANANETGTRPGMTP